MRRGEKKEIKKRIERLKKNLLSRDPEFSNREVIKRNIQKLEKKLDKEKKKSRKY